MITTTPYVDPNDPQQPQGLGGFAGLLAKVRSGLGSVNGSLFPTDPGMGIDPKYAKQQQRAAMFRMAAGIAGGRGLGQGLAQGLDAGTNMYQQAMENAYQNTSRKRQAEMQQKGFENQLAQQSQAQSNFETTQKALSEDRAARLEEARASREALAQYRKDQLEARKLGISVSQAKAEDKEQKSDLKTEAQIRKEFRSLPTVKNYETTLPLIDSAKKAPDNGYGDLQLVYTVGKLLDPDSVVREGELKLTLDAGSPLQKVLGATNFNFEQGGRITPKQRQQLMSMLGERVGSYKTAYERDYNQYSQYAKEAGFKPENIVGTPADSIYSGQKKVSNQAEYDALPAGSTYTAPDGSTRTKKGL